VFWPAFPPDQFLGQLDEAFQERMAESRHAITAEDCSFYHTFVLPDGSVIPGAWDLRGAEAAYLGDVALEGQRVLELGPSSGYLTFFMERQGAEVVGFDAGFTTIIDLLPVRDWDMYVSKTTHMHAIGRFQNAWWWMHRQLGSRAKMVYGDIYDLPGDLGMFDVATFGNILLHLRDPFGALSQAARRTRSTLIVSESITATAADPDLPIMLFDPVGGPNPTNWWALSPGAVRRMVERLGFPRTRLTYHSQKHHIGHDLSVPPVDLPMFTVVGERE
jgi:SAM-dependent methyltransferase